MLNNNLILTWPVSSEACVAPRSNGFIHDQMKLKLTSWQILAELVLMSIAWFRPSAATPQLWDKFCQHGKLILGHLDFRTFMQ